MTFHPAMRVPSRPQEQQTAEPKCSPLSMKLTAAVPWRATCQLSASGLRPSSPTRRLLRAVDPLTYGVTSRQERHPHQQAARPEVATFVQP